MLLRLAHLGVTNALALLRLLAALLHRLPKDVLRGLRLLVRLDTVLRWHRDLIARRHASASRSKRPGRARTLRSIRVLVLLGQGKQQLGCRRLHGELLVLGMKVAPSTVWEILREADIDPAPKRSGRTWGFPPFAGRCPAHPCDFLETSPMRHCSGRALALPNLTLQFNPVL